MDDVVVYCVFFIIGVTFIIKMATETTRKRKREEDDSPDEEETSSKRLRYCCWNQEFCSNRDYKVQEISNRAQWILNLNVENQLRPKGIPNVGSTCFMSSILQCLCGSPNLDWLLANEVHHNNNTGKVGIAECLMMLTSSYRRQEHDVPQETVKKLLKAVRRSNPQFDGYSQQDSFELYNTIIAGIEEEHCCDSEGCPQKKTITVSKLFTGQFMSVFFYDHCNDVDLVFQDFTSLSVPFPGEANERKSKPSKITAKGVTKEQKSRKTGSVSPDDNWAAHRPTSDKFSSKEPHFSSIPESESPLTDLEKEEEQKDKFDDDGDNAVDRPSNHLKLACLNSTNQREGNLTSVEKGLAILTAEDSLYANELPCRDCEKVNKMKGKSGNCYKRLMLAKLPPVLVLHINRFEQCGSALKKIEGEFTYPLDLDIGCFCALPEQMDHRCTKYSLFGAVCHRGNLHGGHYYAYIKSTDRNVKGIRKLLEKKEALDPESRKQELIKAITQLVSDGSSGVPESSNHDKKSASFQKYGKDIGKHFETTPQSDWYYVSDSCVMKEDTNKALHDKDAYILMYETCEEKERLPQMYIVNEKVRSFVV